MRRALAVAAAFAIGYGVGYRRGQRAGMGLVASTVLLVALKRL